MIDNKVQILVSTYNGERFLMEQLDSLFNLNYKSLGILIRDDGSTDTTTAILDSIKDHKLIDNVICDKNVGVINSFFSLLESSDTSSSYFAFCDQDDFWLENKISRAVSILDKYDSRVPLMYCSAKTIVDEELSPFKNANTKHSYCLGFDNALVENSATGCTIVINKAARDLLLKNIPSNCLMHDWWIYLVISFFGKTIYDDESQLLYRQHSANVVGVRTSFVSTFKERINRYLKGNSKELLIQQAQEFYTIYNDVLTEEARFKLKSFIKRPTNIIERFLLLKKIGFYRQHQLDNIIFKILFVFNK